MRGLMLSTCQAKWCGTFKLFRLHKRGAQNNILEERRQQAFVLAAHTYTFNWAIVFEYLGLVLQSIILFVCRSDLGTF